MRSTPPDSPSLLGAKKKSNCCCDVGPERSAVRAKWCLLSGEAGIGKSRLTAALLDRLAGEPHTRLRYFCSPQHIDSALYPIIGQIERAAGFTHDDTSQAKLDKLDALLALTSTSMEDAALFAEMLSLPNDGRYPAVNLTPAAAAENDGSARCADGSLVR